MLGRSVRGFGVPLDYEDVGSRVRTGRWVARRLDQSPSGGTG